MSELIRPFRLQRRTVQKPWAGTGLAALFDWARVLPRGTGETIEASSVAGIETPLDGSELTLDSLMNELGQEAMLGYAKPIEPAFPLMLKFLDTAENLSVQCHPHDRFDAQRQARLSFGKEEAWLVLAADADAVIYQGVRPEYQASFWQELETGRAPEELLVPRELKVGDFLPSPNGIVHAIGGGLTLLEIQQASNTTWRIADFPDREGKPRNREMHREEAKKDARLEISPPELLVAFRDGESSDFSFEGQNFGLTIMDVERGQRALDVNRATFVTIISGTAELSAGGATASLAAGETAFLPAATGEAVMNAQGPTRVSLTFAKAPVLC